MKAVSNKIFCFNFKKQFKFKIHFKYAKMFQEKKNQQTIGKLII